MAGAAFTSATLIVNVSVSLPAPEVAVTATTTAVPPRDSSGVHAKTPFVSMISGPAVTAHVTAVLASRSRLNGTNSAPVWGEATGVIAGAALLTVSVHVVEPDRFGVPSSLAATPML